MLISFIFSYNNTFIMTELEENRQKMFTACKLGDKCLLTKSAMAGVTLSSYYMKDNEGKSPLHIACRYGHIDIVRMLVEVYGCSPKAVDNTGSTPFHDACFYDQVVIVDYFIHTLKNPKEYLYSADIEGSTPFHKSNQSGSSNVIKYIVHTILTGCAPKKLNFDIMIHNHLCSHNSKYDNLFRFLMITNKVGDTPLAVACRHGHLTILKMYIHCFHHLEDMFYLHQMIPMQSIKHCKTVWPI